MVAAESIFQILDSSSDPNAPPVPQEATAYQDSMESSWVYEELKAVRNVHAGFSKGLAPGLAYAGLATHVLKGREPWTFHNTVSDSAKSKKAAACTPIQYPKNDGRYTFDLLTNLQRSGTYHEGDQPVHLRVKKELTDVPGRISYPEYAGPEQRFCPAGVYEYKVEDEGGKESAELIINAQNCVHCKCCR
jgi:electron-transferring-flavoprotein dehydrogenase